MALPMGAKLGAKDFHLGLDTWTGEIPRRLVLHLDIDAFFASVEQLDDKRLRGKPVAVGTGVVASCSYEARRWGVYTAMRLSEARRKCPELIVVPGRYPRYEMMAQQLLEVCQRFTPVVESAALDDFYLDLGAADEQAGERVGRQLREWVRDVLHLSLSIGAGANKLVAQVATHQAKPGRQVQVFPGRERAYLAPWSVTILPGVGPAAARQLYRLGLRRVGDLTQVSGQLLEGLFGWPGRCWYWYAHGLDPRPVIAQRQPHSISRRTSFDPPEADPMFLRAMLTYLLERAASWMRFVRRRALGLEVFVRYGDGQGSSRRWRVRPATNHDAELRAYALEGLAALLQRRLPLRLLGVTLSPLQAETGQLALFCEPWQQRQQRLQQCKDAIRQRFGFLALTSGEELVLLRQLEHDRDRLVLRTPCLTR
ncbi:MAG: DNA polymerase IV [Gemmatales bacterium]|nr:DNA polymerase IV [Gemmatales bacterium]